MTEPETEEYTHDFKLIYEFNEPDPRNYIFDAQVNENNNLEIATTTIPSTNTLKTFMAAISPPSFTISPLVPIINQGNIGSCVANAFSYCITAKTTIPLGFIPPLSVSRLYHYANSRILGNNALNKDTGTTIPLACKAIKDYGAPIESSYPYITSKFINFPPLPIYQSARYFQSFTYTFISQNANFVTSIKTCLTNYNTPIIFGFKVYSSFMTSSVARTGIVPLPNTTREALQGGHCMCLVGYDDTTQRFRCANSWGTSWGAGGYCYIPYTYLSNANLASDFCFIQFVY